MEEYQSNNEEYEEKLEAAKETAEDFGEDENYRGWQGSEPKPLGGLYALFDTVLSMPQSTKVSNLVKEEIGDLGITVRDSLRIALIGKTFHHNKFAEFFMKQSGIITDSAMSRKGWFTELFVTSKKFAARETSVGSLPQNKPSKWTMFGKKEQSQ